MSDTQQVALVITRLVDVLSVVARLTAELQKVSGMIERARAENRELSKEEWAQLDDDLASARQRALESIS